MTLIVALECKDGIVVAGDKRSHDEDEDQTYSDDVTKVFSVNDRVIIAGGGDGFIARDIIDEMLEESGIANKDVNEVKNILISKTRNRLSNWFRPLSFTNIPRLGFIVAGYTRNNESRMYTFDSRETNAKRIRNGRIALGVPLIAEYLFHKEYNREMNCEEVGELAKHVIEETSLISSAVSKESDLITLQSERSE